ncbi:coiled-coil domain-containing protein 14 isoform X1 [Pungitius pungitius]|uniref:coiled-coil domain-containing protein 14 isoform X1 n=1 Tax=Pungitius pungitius TaxID=134920 RepID=UPI001887E5BD|nr:coiled-coil domain-containing protein 14 isoform X1 [Pungitius pungitius]
MKGTAKSKVVTSGRLTGAVRGQIYRRRGTPDPGPAACPKPAYSLYSTSTESEEQVSSLHKGLDRCAALLTNILQVDKADPHMAATSGSPCSSLRKRTIKNTKKDHRGRQPGPGFKAHRPVRKPSTDPTQTSSHSPQTILYPPGTSIPPSQTSIPPCETSIHQPPTSIPPSQTSIPPCETSIHQPPTSIPPSQTSIPPCETSIHQPPTSIPPSQTPIPPCETSIRQPLTSIPPSQTSIPPCEASIDPSQPSIHPPQTSLHLPQTSTSHAYCRVGWDREEAEFVPVRDISVQSCPKRSDMRLGLGQVDRVLLDTPGGRDCKGETDEKVKTVHYLLGELKALIAGQGSVAERLLTHLEQTVTSPIMDAGSLNIWTDPEPLAFHNQNNLLRRRVRFLNQQLKQRERAESHQNQGMLCNPEVWTLQEELSTAQSQLQEVQDDLTELRKALEETQSRLTDREAEKALIQTELEATRSRLLDSERERSELASLAQQRLEDIGNLNRMLQCPPSSSVSDNRHLFTQHRPESDRITQYLMSLGQLEPIPSEHVSAEREVIPIPHRKGGARAAHATVLFQSCHVDQSHGSIRNPHQAPSCCDVESLSSNCSSSSGSTFDTRDEVAFRAGLEALDASIASLQRTIQLDTRR